MDGGPIILKFPIPKSLKQMKGPCWYGEEIQLKGWLLVCYDNNNFFWVNAYYFSLSAILTKMSYDDFFLLETKINFKHEQILRK